MRRSPFVALVVAAALVGCGGSHHETVPAEAMLDSAAAHPIISADAEIESRLRVDGIPQLSGPITLRLDGPYRSGGGTRIPSFDWRMSASAVGFPVSGRLVSTGENIYLTVYGNRYEVGAPAVADANARLAADGGLRLDVRDWLGPARVTGQDSAGGVDCERIAAPLRGDVVARDLAPLAEALGVSEPSVSGRAVACVGFDDRVLHELQLRAAFAPSPADSARLGGATAIHLEADVALSDVGRAEEISAPGGSFRPIRDLLLTLNDLAG
ncbi:MAG TPA: hypothetical protein VLB79_03690 [Solirubrobacterales bacterium]|nr:hypothetical protein [Solirubrobacterales bacterium]